MPLRLTKAIPIEVSTLGALGAPTSASSADSGLGSAGVQPQILADTVLPITPRLQEHSLWCWAACVEMVRSHYQKPALKQCEIAAKAKNKDTAAVCANPDVAGKGCNKEEMGTVWNANELNFVLHPETANDSGQITFEQLIDEINANQPVEVGLVWHESAPAGHAVLVKGFGEKLGRNSVWINDPWSPSNLGTLNGGEGEILFKELKDAFGNGEWVSTWTGLTER